MPRIDTLGPQQVHQIYAYIRAGAREALRADQSTNRSATGAAHP